MFLKEACKTFYGAGWITQLKRRKEVKVQVFHFKENLWGHFHEILSQKKK